MNKIIIDEKAIEDLLFRSVVDVIPSKEDLKSKLKSGQRLKVYIGMDPTFTALHLGHSTNIIWLEKFRRLGHEVIFLVGDFTARIGDPTDRDAVRVQLTRDDVKKNMKLWIDMIKPLIDIDNKDNPVKIRYNHDWLSKMNFEDVINLTSHFTVQQMLERDMFELRIKQNKPIFVHEFFYPLMQGYDSVVLDVDIELCGTDQLFNALTGRTLLKKIKNKDKFVITTSLLENPVTHEKMMSKSKGTGIFLNEKSSDMFGKVMSQPDENISQLFTDCTYVSMEEINEIVKKIQTGEMNPRDAKMRLALEITKIYHGEKEALETQEKFINIFSKREIPEEMLEILVERNKVDLVKVLTENKVVSSKSEVRRLMQAGAIKVNEEKYLGDGNLEIEDVAILKIGKRRFVKLIKS